MTCHTPAAPEVPDWQRESSTILGQVTFLLLCIPACYLSDRLLQRGAASRFPTMAAAAAGSSACSFFVLGNARHCSAAQLTVSWTTARVLLLLRLLLLPLLCSTVVLLMLLLCTAALVCLLGFFGVFCPS